MDRKLVIISQVADRRDSNLGFAAGWWRELSRTWPEICVIARAGTADHFDVPVRVVKWDGGRLRRLLRLLSALWAELSGEGSGRSVVLAHQCPAFAIAAALPARLTATPLALFYAHGSLTLRLRIAAALATKVITSTEEGCRVRSQKIAVIGQGIPEEWFESVRWPRSDRRVLIVGRVARSKGVGLAIDCALSMLGKEVPVHVLGGTHGRDDEEYLSALAEAYPSVNFHGPVERGEVRRQVAEAWVVMNLSTTGSLDKVAVEAAALGTPVISSNPAVRRLLIEAGLPHLAVEHDSEAVGAALGWLAQVEASGEGRQLQARLRAFAAPHRLTNFIPRLSAELASL